MKPRSQGLKIENQEPDPTNKTKQQAQLGALISDIQVDDDPMLVYELMDENLLSISQWNSMEFEDSAVDQEEADQNKKSNPNSF